MARAMRAWGEWKPKAAWVVKRIFATDSVRPLGIPRSMTSRRPAPRPAVAFHTCRRTWSTASVAHATKWKGSARGHLANEAAALKCVYPGQSPRPDGAGPPTLVTVGDLLRRVRRGRCGR